MGDRLRERVALVTGGGTGFGKAIALGLAREGADLIIAARRPQPLDDVAVAIRNLGRRALVVIADVTKRADVDAMAARAIAEFGRVDILINNSGVFPPIPVLAMPEEVWVNTIDTNLHGAFRCVQALAPQMVERRKGRIISITSPSAFMGFATMGAYASSKGALVAFTRCLAAELTPFGVTVNCVCPGITPTEGFRDVFPDADKDLTAYAAAVPGRRPGRPEDAVGAVVYLASDDADYVTGETIVVDGGMTSVFFSPQGE